MFSGYKKRTYVSVSNNVGFSADYSSSTNGDLKISKILSNTGITSSLPVHFSLLTVHFSQSQNLIPPAQRHSFFHCGMAYNFLMPLCLANTSHILGFHQLNKPLIPLLSTIVICRHCSFYLTNLKLYDKNVFQNNQIIYKIKQEQKQDLSKCQGF